MRNFNHQFIASNIWQLQEINHVELNLQQINFFSPIGLTFLAGYIENQMSISETGRIQFNHEVLNYLERMEFLEHLENKYSNRLEILPPRPTVHRRPHPDSLIEFREIEFGDRFEMEDCISNLIEITQSKVGDILTPLYIDDAYAELLDNINRHSESKRFFVLAQAYQNSVKISICDLGVGIPYRIKSHFLHIRTDNEAIIHATESGVSTYVEGGWGLTTLCSYLESPGDYLFIASNNGCVKFIRNRSYPYSRFRCDYTGTFIELSFRTDVTRTLEIEDSSLPF